MGARCSKIKNHHGYSKLTSDLTPDLSFYQDACPLEPFDSRIQKRTSDLTPDLSFYQDVCGLEPFDSRIQKRTSRVISSLEEDVGVGSLSLASLRELTNFHKLNQEVVKLILECKNDILKNRYLSDLVKDYLVNSDQTSKLCNALQKCLKHARDSQLSIQSTINQFDQFEQKLKGFPRGVVNNVVCLFKGKRKTKMKKRRKMYRSTLQELKEFTTAGDPFTEEFYSLLESVCESQSSMLEKLAAKKSKLDKKLKNVKAWKAVSNVIFVMTFASVLICSVVAAAIAAPPVLTALAAAAVAVLPLLGKMGEWMNSLLKKCENDLKGQRKVMSSLDFWTRIGKCELDNIGRLVDRSKIEIGSFLRYADFAVKNADYETAVILAMDELKKRVDGFMKSIDDLSEHTEYCSRDILNGRKQILETIVKHTLVK